MMTPEIFPTIWIIDDDQSIRWVLERSLEHEAFRVESFADAQSALEKLHHLSLTECPQAILCDIRMPGMDGLSLLKKLKSDFPEIPVIIMTAHSDLEVTIASFQGGAFDYLAKPFDIEDAVRVVKRALETHEKSENGSLDSPSQISDIIGKAPAMQNVFRAIGRLSSSKVTVLIIGASGTGKELIAKALHRHSVRALAPFIALNMAAIPKDLIEAELFGHEKGAFTSAGQLRQGRFEQANEGTLFLDEIGDMPLEAQTRLLRVLAEGKFYRIGGNTPIQVDVRIIAATHQDLEKSVQEGRFREDLFHRLNVIRIQMPSLAERAEDIPALANHFLVKAAEELQTERKQLSIAAMDYLKKLPWPGNVRQLENLCHWLTVMVAGRTIQWSDLPNELKLSENIAPAQERDPRDWDAVLAAWMWNVLSSGQAELLKTVEARFESVLIETALRYTKGARGEAAILLGWGRNTLTRKIKELNLESQRLENSRN